MKLFSSFAYIASGIIFCTPHAEAELKNQEFNSGGLKSQMYLVVNLSRGGGKWDQGYSQAVFSIPVKSREDCQVEGQKISEQNTKEVRAVFWCVEGTK